MKKFAAKANNNATRKKLVGVCTWFFLFFPKWFHAMDIQQNGGNKTSSMNRETICYTHLMDHYVKFVHMPIAHEFRWNEAQMFDGIQGESKEWFLSIDLDFQLQKQQQQQEQQKLWQ